MDMYKDVNW